MTGFTSISINKAARKAEELLEAKGIKIERSKIYRMGLRSLVVSNGLEEELSDLIKSIRADEVDLD